MPGFDIGHLLLLGAIALLVFGPERLQEIVRTLGDTVAEFRRASQNLTWSDAWDHRAHGGPIVPFTDGATPGGPPATETQAREMTMVEHVNELRTRILYSLVPVLVASALCFYLSDTLLRMLKAPAGPGFQINAFGPMDGFMLRWKVALFGGLLLSAPFWSYELLAFVAPALTEHERRFFYPMLAALAGLFLLGAGFGYVMLGGMIRVMFTMFGREINYLPNANQYISFVVFFMLACSLVFELPVLLLVLVRLGVLQPNTLRRQRRIAYFLLFVFAEVITPVADPIVAPMIVMTPLILLYEGAIFCSRFVVPRTEPAAA